MDAKETLALTPKQAIERIKAGQLLFVMPRKGMISHNGARYYKAKKSTVMAIYRYLKENGM